MSGPVAITGLACHFAPETRNLPQGGTVTRYTGGQCLIDFPRPEGGKAYICEIRRLRPGKGRLGAWRKTALAELVEREQTPDAGHEKTITTER